MSEGWESRRRVTAGDLAGDLRRVGLGPGAVVLVHSSLSRLGHVVGGAEAAIDALVEAVSPGGTVLFPTLTGASQDGPDCPPLVDVRATSCWTGRIPDSARRRARAWRSLHPTHSVCALGAEAELWTAGHELGLTPCDRWSPYYRLVAAGGYILFLGTTQESNTTLHCLEELANVPYHLQPELTDGVVVDASGVRRTVRNRLHLWRWHRDFAKVEGPLAAVGALHLGAVGEAESRLVRASEMAECLLPRLREDPLFLLDGEARMAFQQAER